VCFLCVVYVFSLAKGRILSVGHNVGACSAKLQFVLFLVDLCSICVRSYFLRSRLLFESFRCDLCCACVVFGFVCGLFYRFSCVAFCAFYCLVLRIPKMRVILLISLCAAAYAMPSLPGITRKSNVFFNNFGF